MAGAGGRGARDEKERKTGRKIISLIGNLLNFKANKAVSRLLCAIPDYYRNCMIWLIG
jgi:hypothetical protein